MKNLLEAFCCFSNINIAVKKKSEDSMKYVLCYFPMVGLALGIILWIWFFAARRAGINPFITGAAAAVIAFAFLGSGVFNSLEAMLGKFKIAAIVLYGAALWYLFAAGSAIEVLTVGAAFVLTRTAAVMLIYDSNFADESIYKKAESESSRGVTAIITVVWLMGTVAFIEMVSLLYFFAIFLIMAAMLILFYMKIKRIGVITDDIINCFIVSCEIIIFAAVIVINFFIM